MRINLVTPFAEKDQVKALGARWDATRKVWYVVNVPDLSPFTRWIPDLAAAQATEGPSSLKKPSPNQRAPRMTGAAGAASPSTGDVAHCGCQVLPWDDCVHTRKA
jgi:hypothetical protein